MNRRKSFLIYPKFQLGFIIKMFIMALFNSLVIVTCMRFFFKDLLKKAMEEGLGVESPLVQFIQGQYDQFFIITLISVVVSSLLITIFGVFISHRIAGPLYRLQQDIEQMVSTKEYKTIFFRKGDHFQELRLSVNKLIKQFKE